MFLFTVILVAGFSLLLRYSIRKMTSSYGLTLPSSAKVQSSGLFQVIVVVKKKHAYKSLRSPHARELY